MNDLLKGLCVLNTRPADQAQQLTERIQNAGGTVIACPALQIIPANNKWMHLLPDLSSVHQAIFISANAVHCCFKQLNINQICWPTHIKVIAIGPSSAQALMQYSITAIETPKIPDSEHLLNLDSLQQLKKQTVLLFKGEGGRSLIEEHISDRGAKLIPIDVYKRAMPDINQELLHTIWKDDLVDIILFTSEQSMRQLFIMFGEDAHNWLKNKPCIVISNRLARTAALLGIKNVIITDTEHMLNTLSDFSKGINT